MVGPDDEEDRSWLRTVLFRAVVVPESFLQGFGRHVAYRVGQCVPPEVTVPAEHLTTGGTLVRLVVRMSEQVGLQVAALVKASRADGALVWRFFHVKYLVHC